LSLHFTFSGCNIARNCVTIEPGIFFSLVLSPRRPARKACLGPSVPVTCLFRIKLSQLFRFVRLLPMSTFEIWNNSVLLTAAFFTPRCFAFSTPPFACLLRLQLIEGENSRTLQPLLKRKIHKNFAE
jgi:hypothetical protein